MKPLLSLLILSLLCGCSFNFWRPEPYKAEGPKISEVVRNLPPAETVTVASQEVSVGELVADLEKLQQPELQTAIASRVAQLRLQVMQDELAEGDTDYRVPIKALRKLRDLTTDPAEKAKIEYQLARVMSLASAQLPEIATPVAVLESLSESIDETESESIELEARFRRAELNFSNQNFEAAATDFAVVADAPGEYQLHAGYMLSWVRFKQGDLDYSLTSATTAFQRLSNEAEQRNIELKQDLTRVTVLALDYLDGPETLAQAMKELNYPTWQTDLYRALGDWYLSKERFNDSALTWQTFLAENPLHAAAPDIALEVIETQRQAGFVADIPDLEHAFIQRYGKQTEFYALHGDPVFSNYETTLRDMLDRYSQRLHATAQESETASDYASAAAGYEIWLTNFSHTSAAQEKQFLYAEVLEQAYGFSRARQAYEQAIATNIETEYAKEAAYAVVVGLSLDQEDSVIELEDIVAANLRFARHFASDHRASTTQLTAAKLLFEAEQFSQALQVVEVALSMSPDSEQQLVAKRIRAHSAFALEDFALAENFYTELIELGEPNQEQLVAVVFKQAEQAEQNADLLNAILHFERLVAMDPRSSLSLDIAYDLVSLYERTSQLDKAVAQLEQFRVQYPRQQIAADSEVAKRIINLRETLGDLDGAAAELVTLSQRSTGESARVARYRAAELYLQLDDLPNAIEHFRFYAHNFLEPAGIRMEAMHHMDQLYQRTEESGKRKFWLRKKRDLYRDLSQAEQSDRVKYLAAEAIYILSEPTFEAYKSSPLKHPLARSLKKKQQLLTQSLKNYQAVIEVGAYEFTALSQFRMAEHYELLATDLMAAPTPKNLNPLEQEQYQFLLEEQAFPFEEKAIALHERNLELGWEFGWNQAVDDSLQALKKLSPAQFNRNAMEVAYVVPSK